MNFLRLPARLLELIAPSDGTLIFHDNSGKDAKVYNNKSRIINHVKTSDLLFFTSQELPI
jgi:hypothetical protein